MRIKGSRHGVGISDFKMVIDTDNFYIDKTHFIEEWYEDNSAITLITRPRRFGKTMTMSMLEYFFSDKCKEQAYLFENLEIWENEKYRILQGTIPVVNISFAGIGQLNGDEIYDALIGLIRDIYMKYDYLLDGDILKTVEKEDYNDILLKKAKKYQYEQSLRKLSEYIERNSSKKVYIFIDEYDVPLQKAYVGGFWEEVSGFIMELFRNTFKDNSHLARGIITGVSRVAKESLFSGLNNLLIATVTSKIYEESFGFTEEEVFTALDMYGLSNEKQGVKKYYDGFTMGGEVEIYNPWSVLNFIKMKEYNTYWANTSSNELLNTVLQNADIEVKKLLEELVNGETIKVSTEENIIYKDLDKNSDAVWSLMIATGYLKVLEKKFDNYTLAITNQEAQKTIEKIIQSWFSNEKAIYNEFIKAMLAGNAKIMQKMLNKLSVSMFSVFDSGKKASRKEPERFYHGFVLGLIVDLRNKYSIKSNRESGYGRYDVMLKPIFDKKLPGIIIEFKVLDSEDESGLEECVMSALKQINDMKYEQELNDEEIHRIYKYGIAFDGKTCRIGIQ